MSDMVVNDLKNVITVGCVALVLSACGGDDPRYRNTALLERPPVLAVQKSASDTVVLEDDAVLTKKKHKKGLEDDVYLSKSDPTMIYIKQPINEAWNTVKLALTQSDIKITDEVRDKSQYFVSFNPPTLFGMVTSIVTKEEKQVIYVLTVEEIGQETRVSVKKATSAEQTTALDATNRDTETTDDAEALLNRLFDTLRDELITV